MTGVPPRVAEIIDPWWSHHVKDHRVNSDYVRDMPVRSPRTRRVPTPLVSSDAEMRARRPHFVNVGSWVRCILRFHAVGKRHIQRAPSLTAAWRYIINGIS